MTFPISIGDTFGRLTVQKIQSLGAGKARRIFCICQCGQKHDADANRIFLGQTTQCRSCANPKIYTETEYRRRQNYFNYKNGAERRGYDYLLTMEEFLKFSDAPCVYCGLTPAKGIDRRDNLKGYILENCASCCKQCNLAKRDMTEKEFFSWLQRLVQHQKAWI